MKRSLKYLAVAVVIFTAALHSCKEDADIPVTHVTLDVTEETLTVGSSGLRLRATVYPSDATNQDLIWESDNPEVAGIDGDGKVTAYKPGVANIIVTSVDGGKTARCTITAVPAVIPVTGVTLDQKTKTLTAIGESFLLKATVQPSDATNQVVSWKSSNNDAVTVENGRVTAKSSGVAVITVTTAEGEKTDVCTVTVEIAVTGVSIDVKQKTLNAGEAFTLTATVTPSQAANKNVAWTSSNNAVATVTVADETVTVTAVGSGEAIITVTTADGAKTATCAVTVAPVEPVFSVRRELRGAWLVSAYGSVDWPLGRYDAASQQKLYTDYLDKYVANNINAVFMQIRPMGDAFYDSPYEPWSGYITGTRGNKPSYDVLQFMIDEAHKRGLEFHAWINPFRISTGAASSWPPLHPSVPAGWVKDYPSVTNPIRVYNPAIPEVHQRLADIVEDIITKYDVDGIHMDDYFYPDIGAGNLNDAAEFNQYGQGFFSIANWRRNNVDIVIQKIHDVIVNVNPRVVFSISPQSSEYNNYNSLFADIEKWCQNKWIDVVIPQIYQPVGNGSSDYPSLLNLWATKYAIHVPCLVGLPAYRVANPSESVVIPVNDFDEMFRLLRANDNISGSILYNSSAFNANRGGATDMMRTKYNQTPAIRPVFGRITEAAPVMPSGVQLNGVTLSWSANADLTSVVYLIPEGTVEAKVVAVTKGNSCTVAEKGEYFVSTINKNNVESAISKGVAYN
jgi:uncharacterized lipoprotein YddW (UPF0748 family)/uncharacterized protein YjdB